MPYADSDGVQIYYEVEGNPEGPPLVLQHGLTGYLESWRERGYTEVLGGDYRLILIDARGHGHSDKPHEPSAYARELRAADVVAVLDDLDIEKTYYFGYSMGGRIGCALLSHAADRLTCAVMGGFDPYITESAATLPETMEEFGAHIDERPNLTPEVRARLMANDLDALLASTVGSKGPAMADGALAQDFPILLFSGENDAPLEGAKKAAEEATDGQFFMVPGADHQGASADVGYVGPRVKAFLDSVAVPGSV